MKTLIRHYFRNACMMTIGGMLMLNTAFAGNGKTPEERARERTDLMVCQLNITSQKQIDQIYKINLNAAKEMDEIGSTYKMNTAEQLKQAKRVEQEHTDALEDVLSPSQWARFERTRKDPQRNAKLTEECRKQMGTQAGKQTGELNDSAKTKTPHQELRDMKKEDKKQAKETKHMINDNKEPALKDEEAKKNKQGY